MVTSMVVVVTSHYYEESTCHQPLNVLATSRKISDFTKRDFFQLHFPDTNRKFDKVLSYILQQFFGPFTMLTIERCSEILLFRHSSKHVIRLPLFWKSITYERHLFFQNVQNFMLSSEMEQKVQKKVLCFLDNRI